MRWKAYFYHNPNISTSTQETYGFNTTKNPPYVKEMGKFEERMRTMIQNIKFKTTTSAFQKKLNKDIQLCTKDKNVIVAADKTNNFYKMKPDEYNKLLQNTITKDYKKVDNSISDEITQGDKSIATSIKLDDRITTTAKHNAFVTLKDHKPNFQNNPSCRLINPAKTEIGIVSKQILDKINKTMITQLKNNIWTNTTSVLQWFNNIANPKDHSFIEFDIIDFYPSISETLLTSAIKFARKYCNITKDDEHIIHHTKKSLLYNAGQTWRKKNAENCFDVTMGSYDGAETCTLVGIFLLSLITERHGNTFGLYRDDGLGALKASPRAIENIKKTSVKSSTSKA